ncbi:MAG: HD domain-containing protein [Candidatus Phosphoribacter sp.]
MAGSPELVHQAEALARAAHKDQVDKAGLPYIHHPARVATRVVGDDLAQATAWLHDVVEDTEVTLTELAEAGFPEAVVAAVDALTRRPDEPADDYYARVAADPLALLVKRADIADNCSPERLGLLDDATQTRLLAKYTHAREVLASADASAQA